MDRKVTPAVPHGEPGGKMIYVETENSVYRVTFHAVTSGARAA